MFGFDLRDKRLWRGVMFGAALVWVILAGTRVYDWARDSFGTDDDQAVEAKEHAPLPLRILKLPLFVLKGWKYIILGR